MRAFAVTVIVLALAAPAAAGKGRNKKKSKKTAPAVAALSMHDVVLERATAGIPEGLALVEVDLSPSIAELDARGAAVSIQWRRAVRAGHQSLLIEVRDRHGKLVRGWARLDVREVRSVLVAARPLERGAGIRDGDLVVRNVPVERGEGWSMRPDDLIGSAILGDVAVGAVIGPDSVVAPPPVPRGTTVTVVVSQGPVAVKAAGLLERAGMPGERVPVRLLSHARLVHGRLVGRDHVEIAGSELR